MATSRTIYVGELRTENEHIRSGQKLITDAPVDNQGKGEAFSPTDLVATALSLVSWPLMARLVRSETLSLKSRDFVMASRGLGASQFRIIFKHILPNVMWLIIVAATVDVASVIVNEATLSLLGLGIEEPAASLGLMIFRAVGKIESHPLQVFIPAAVITTLVIAFSFLGDGLRDALDPRSR